MGGILALSRAMGDFSLKKSLQSDYDPVSGAVCALPDVKVGYLSPGSHATAVIACDGIWDVLKSHEAIQIAENALSSSSSSSKKSRKNMHPAHQIVLAAFEKKSTDNLTCLVVRLFPRLETKKKS